MGTAGVQGPLWDARARDWAELQEGMSRPIFDAVFDTLGIGEGTRLLDVGCGAGLATQLARARGAQVAGLDASDELLAIARQRLPAGDFRTGEMEELPYPEATFDVVTGFNSFQYAANPVAALREARRVAKPGGRVAMVVWGQPEQCEHAATLAAIGRCLPPPPPGAGGPFALSAPGRVEALMEQAGLRPVEHGEVDAPFAYPDVETALRAMSSSGPANRAVQHAGEAAVRQAILDSLGPFHTPEGGVLQRNVFRYVIART